MRVYIKKELKEAFSDEDIYLITLTKGEIVIGGIALYNKEFEIYSFCDDFRKKLLKNNIDFVEFLTSLHAEKEFFMVEPTKTEVTISISHLLEKINEFLEKK